MYHIVYSPTIHRHTQDLLQGILSIFPSHFLHFSRGKWLTDRSEAIDGSFKKWFPGKIVVIVLVFLSHSFFTSR